MSVSLTLVIVNYNQGIYFEDCIRSVKQQLDDVELIIVDDCSTDNSVQQIESLLSSYNVVANFIKNRENRGICANLNMALQIAKGKFFSFIASDDWVESDCYQLLMHALDKASEKVAVAYGDCKLVSESKQLLQESYIRSFRPDLKASPEGDVFEDLLSGNFIPAMVTMSKTDVLRNLGGFDERLKVEDYDMWLRVSRNYYFLFVKGASAYYRILPNSLIRRLGARKFEDWIDMYIKHSNAESNFLPIIKKQILKCCEFLYYTDSANMDSYYRKTKKIFGLDGKLTFLWSLKVIGIRGSNFKNLTNKIRRRQNK